MLRGMYSHKDTDISGWIRKGRGKSRLVLYQMQFPDVSYSSSWIRTSGDKYLRLFFQLHQLDVSYSSSWIRQGGDRGKQMFSRMLSAYNSDSSRRFRTSGYDLLQRLRQQQCPDNTASTCWFRSERDKPQPLLPQLRSPYNHNWKSELQDISRPWPTKPDPRQPYGCHQRPADRNDDLDPLTWLN